MLLGRDLASNNNPDNLMKLHVQVAVAALCSLFGTSANAQFSAFGSNISIPQTGTGGEGASWPQVLPLPFGQSTATVPVPVTSIDSIQFYGLHHERIGDLQFVLVDPNGIGHNLLVRPGVGDGGSPIGNTGEFLVGGYTFVESGGATLPGDAGETDLSAGVYNQSFTTGVGIWPSGLHGILNTPLSQITGPAGNWTLKVYDWKEEEWGASAGWILNGNGVVGNNGSAYCFGDGTGAVCPCSAYGAAGEGCMTTSGTGARLEGTGDANQAFDTFQLTVTGGPPNKFGIFFQGTQSLGAPAGDGIICLSSDLRHAVTLLNGNGSVSGGAFGSHAPMGGTTSYQFWFRDPDNTCGAGGFNFTNGWKVEWN